MSGHNPKQPLQLLDLPNEILSHVLSFYDSEPPSLRDVKDQPSQPFVNPEPSTPLKKTSTLNHRLRKLALPLLFHHIFVCPERLASITAFTSSQNLEIHVTSAQIYLPGPSSHRRPPWWSLLLTQYPQLSTLTITAPPNVFAEIVSHPIKLADQWAFKIPYQTLQLKHDPHNTTTTPINSTTLLHARPWTTLLINSSSSLYAYTTYEYFLRVTPSPLSRHSSPSLLHLLHNLTSFTFIAIFPFYNHVSEITDLMRHHMPYLEKLAVKLLPDPKRDVLAESLRESGGHFDVRDCWTEFETSVSLLGHAAVALSRRGGGDGEKERYEEHQWTGKLRELRLDDVQMEGVRNMVEATVTRILTEDGALGWAYDGEGSGLWVRSPTMVTTGSTL